MRTSGGGSLATGRPCGATGKARNQVRAVSALAVLAWILFALLSPEVALAQDVCRTANCAPIGFLPAGCAGRAEPYTLEVHMVFASLGYAFSPTRPKIEEGDCIRWQDTTGAVHTSSHEPCDPLCIGPPEASCKWDTDLIFAANSTCHYDAAHFPGNSAPAGLHYYCRVHALPTDTEGMVGDLRVTKPIRLSVIRSGNDVRLSWTGGGVADDFTYEVKRSANDLRFQPMNTATHVPDGGPTGTTYTDPGAAASSAFYSYLVRNKN